MGQGSGMASSLVEDSAEEKCADDVMTDVT